jgi:hypothetical protein
MIPEAWFLDTDTDRITGRAMGNTARACPITHSMPRGKGTTDSSPRHTSRGKKVTATILDTAVIKAMDMDLLRITIITKVTGQEGALQTLHISSNKRLLAAEFDSLPKIKPLDRSSSVL